MLSNKTRVPTIIAGIMLLTLAIAGCGESPPIEDKIIAAVEVEVEEIVPMPPGKEVTLAHPWLNREFWSAIADDENDYYNFECAFGVPFVRKSGHPPLLITQSIPNMKQMEARIRQMMWEVCGDMTWKEWAERK